MDYLKKRIIEIGDKEEATDIAYFYTELNNILGIPLLLPFILSGLPEG